MQNLFQVGMVAVIVVFQPELRSALEKVGAEPLRGLRSISEKSGNDASTIAMINEVTEARVRYVARQDRRSHRHRENN